MRIHCNGLNENGFHILEYLNTWSPVWEGLEGVPLLEKACHESGLRALKRSPHSQLALSALAPCLPACCHAPITMAMDSLSETVSLSKLLFKLPW